MESGRTHPGSSPSSTFATDLFGSNDTSSSYEVFQSIFSPPTSKEIWRDELGKKQDIQLNKIPEVVYKSLDSIFDGEIKRKVQDPCHLSSSIYYGGQDLYSDPDSSQSSTSVTFKNDGYEDDPHIASRGNWWQGSLYY